MSHLKYKGYSASVTFEADSDVFVGRLVGIDDIISFEADNAQDLKTAFVEAVDDYLNHCKAIGKEPKKAFSGKFMLRVPPELHAKLAEAAAINNLSLNEFAERTLEKSIN